MYRKIAAVTIVVLLLSLAFASVSFAQTGTGAQVGAQVGTQTGVGAQASAQAKVGAQGSAPEKAFTNLGNSRNLKAGEQMWFAFQYAGDNSPIQIRLTNASNMQFSVWTQQDIQNAAGNYGVTAQPVGRSTPNQQFGGDQYWTGSFNNPGTYYCMVENANGGQGGKFTLQITGTGVSFQAANASNATSTQASEESKESASTVASEKSTNKEQGASNTSSSTSTTGTSTSTTGTNNSTAQGGVSPKTLPTTGGEMASVFPMLLGGMGALSVAAGAFLRRKK